MLDYEKLEKFVDEHELTETYNDLQSYENLKEAAITCIQDDEMLNAAHITEALKEEASYYKYDVSMGTLEEVTPIHDLDELFDLYPELEDLKKEADLER